MQIVRRNQNKIEVNLLGLLQLFWKNKVKIFLFSILCGGLVLAVAIFCVTPMYTAKIILYANNSNSTDKNTSITSSDLTASVQLVDTYAAIILTDNVLDTVIEELNLQLDTDELLDRISIEAVNDTEVFSVAVKDSSPDEAAAIANKIGEVAPVQIERIVDGCSVKVVNEAKVPNKQSSPNYKKISIIGFLAGFIIILLILFLREILDTRIKSEDDLQLFGLPMLASVPDFAEARKMKSYSYKRETRK